HPSTSYLFLFCLHRPPPTLPLFPFTTLFRSPRGRVAFAHRRLSIIDIAGGSQPMCSDDGRIALVFNGEIYNYRELRRALSDQGRSEEHTSELQSRSDLVCRLLLEKKK